ncbi:MAG: hypothetical protein KBS35_00110 [Mycoplasma sp.]|nr:hypothetical protein [Candidatus Hennigella equi]
MKLINKIMLPALAITSVVVPATIATSCGCNYAKKDEDGLVALDRNYFIIEDHVLKGFKPEFQDKSKIAKGDYKLSIFADITSIADGVFYTEPASHIDSTDLIQKIDFEPNCVCTSLGLGNFNGCTNLKKLVLPPKLTTLADGFAGCSNLTTIDVTGLEQPCDVSEWAVPKDDRWSKTGTVIYDGSKIQQLTIALTFVNKINEGDGNNWTVTPLK